MHTDNPTPSRRWIWGNFLFSQLAWFAAVLGAAHGMPGWGAVPALVVVLWHLRLAPRPSSEAALIVGAVVPGTAADALVLAQGVLAYTSGQWAVAAPPLWMSALWAVFATSLNLSLRWLHARWWLAALIGAVAGPLAFFSGARLGAATLLDPGPALAWLSLEWAIVLPALCLCARRFDGVGPAIPASAAARAAPSAGHTPMRAGWPWPRRRPAARSAACGPSARRSRGRSAR